MPAKSPQGIPSSLAVKNALVVARHGARAVVRTAIARPDHIPAWSLLLLSAAALSYELLLSRLLAIVNWQHFSFLIIGVALLGGTAGAAVVSLWRNELAPYFARAYIASLALFGVCALLGFLAAQSIPFTLEDVLWDLNQPALLLLVCGLLGLPFFFCGLAGALVITHHHAEVGRAYTLLLTGGGIGALLLIGLLYLFMPDTTLRIVCALGCAAAAIAWLELRCEPRFGSAIFGLLACVPFLLPAEWTAPNPAPQKSLSQALQVGGANPLREYSSPLGMLSVVENTLVPMQYAPGLSLNATHEPPEQIGIYTDADALTVVTRPTRQPQEMDYLDQLTSALPYHLRPMQRVLVIGAGGGADVLQARYHNVPLIDAVESNPQIVRIVRDSYGAFSGGIYDAPDVRVHTTNPRGYIARTDERYDLIQITLHDAIATTTSGRHGLSENYLYTVEALQQMLARLEPGGMIAFTRWVNLPPRDVLKFFSMLTAALDRNGVLDPGEQVVLIRGWQTATLVVKGTPFVPSEIAQMQQFCRQRNFDVGYYAGMQEDETSRHNVTDRAYFYLGAQAMVSDKRDAYIDRYKFNLLPATDDRPYFYDFFKWRNLGEMLALRDKGGVVTLEWSYLVAVTALICTFAGLLALTIAPLLFSQRVLRETPQQVRIGRVAMFFLATGAAAGGLADALIQKFTLALNHPLVAVAIVLAGLLIFGGVGSLWAQRFADTRHHRIALLWSVLGISALTLLYWLTAAPLFTAIGDWPLAVQLLIAIALIAPLGFCMGLPVPLALDQVGTDSVPLMAWAFGIHTGATVFGTALAVVLAMHLGFVAVMFTTLTFYGLAALLYPPVGESF